MSVSKTTVDTVYAQLKARPSGATYAELAKLTDLSIATIKSAIGNLKMTGSIAFSHSRPIVVKAIEAPPMPGQTLIIREPMPALEMDSEMVNKFVDTIHSDKVNFSDELLVVLFTRIRQNSIEKNEKLMAFLINMSEAIRQHLASSTELSIEDLDGK